MKFFEDLAIVILGVLTGYFAMFGLQYIHQLIKRGTMSDFFFLLRLYISRRIVHPLLAPLDKRMWTEEEYKRTWNKLEPHDQEKMGKLAQQLFDEQEAEKKRLTEIQERALVQQPNRVFQILLAGLSVPPRSL